MISLVLLAVAVMGLVGAEEWQMRVELNWDGTEGVTVYTNKAVRISGPPVPAGVRGGVVYKASGGGVSYVTNPPKRISLYVRYPNWTNQSGVAEAECCRYWVTEMSTNSGAQWLLIGQNYREYNPTSAWSGMSYSIPTEGCGGQAWFRLREVPSFYTNTP